MKKETIFFALCYELAMEAVKKWPSIRLLPWFPLLLAYCLPFWTEWKTSLTLQKVDLQAKELVKQWEGEDRETVADKLADKAQELFPKATITPLPDAIVPSVMIVHEAAEGSSDAVKALGGELRITWRLE
ncbi:MAG: hypothetical protein ACO23H_20775 [Alphaproteobacteria bacterium]